MTVREVAELLRVGQETVRRWLRDGKLRGVLISDRGGYRMTRAEVDRFIREELGWQE